MPPTLKAKYDIDIPTIDVISWLFNEPAHDVDAPLFVNYDSPSELLTTRTLLSAVRRIAKGLRDIAKVKKGDVVLLCAGNTLWYTPFLLGTIAAGAIFTGANPAYLETELSHQLQDSGATAIFVSPSKLELALKCAAKLGMPQSQIYLFIPERSSRGGVSTLGDILSVGETDWERLTTLQEVAETTAVLAYSSGTSTGRSKACEITHHNMVACAAGAIHHRARGDDARRARGIPVVPDVCAAFLPLFHIMGQNTFCVINVKAGRLTYIMANYSFPVLLEAIQRLRISFLLIAPPIAVQLVKSPLTKKHDLSSVKNLFSGGAALSKDCALDVDRVLDPSGELKMTQAWGMSETAGTAALFGAEILEPDKSAVGHLISNLELRLVDDNGLDVPWDKDENAVGEILIRGPSVFKGYWNDVTATREAFTEDGWFKTGDVGKINKSGVLFLVDRKKEMIKVKGFAVAPAELEDVLLQHEDVADAAVVGVTRHGQEQPRAYVVPARPGVDPRTIVAFVASRLAPYKQLTAGVVFLEAIPKNPAGKILRRVLREHAQRETRKDEFQARL